MIQDNSIKILSAKQISIQKPLSEEWMDAPERYTDEFVRAVDPDFKQFISAGDARRMGKLLKRALTTSISALQESGVTDPDAIITGTGFGSVENTELFLEAMVRDGEQMLKPTQFMQSTHNTASSLIGINTHCHGYNSTYSQKGLSFDSALYDVWLQFRLGKIRTALVGSHDEMSPVFSGFMRKAGHVRAGEICSEANVSVLLSNQTDAAASCTLEGVKILNCPDRQALKVAIDDILAGEPDVDAVMTGMSGNRENDSWYGFLHELMPRVPLLQYKHLFGVNFSSSAIGFYAAVSCMNRGYIPGILASDGKKRDCSKGILLINVVENRHFSISLLRPICGKL